jgi:hypothetical protein
LPYFELQAIGYRNRYACPPEMALCVLLYRLAAPNRLKEDMALFHRSRSWLSSIFNNVVEHLVDRYEQHLFWDNNRLTVAQIKNYTRIVELKGGVKGVWGFIDGTMRAICRPTSDQRRYYSGYKKCHAYKFQAIMTPDGILSSLAGPWPGREGDWGMFVSSGLEPKLRQINQGLTVGDRSYLYGDPAYALSYGVISSYKALPGQPLSPVLKAMNAHMSDMRVCIEHGFGKTMNLWGFNGHKTNLKSGISPVAGYYLVAILLSNIHSCIFRNQTCRRFHCDPPSLQDYLSLHA